MIDENKKLKVIDITDENKIDDIMTPEMKEELEDNKGSEKDE